MSDIVSIESLLKRAFMFLEDGKWTSADEYCERVLDIDPENATAYVGKLMADLKVKTQDALKDCAAPFDANDNYHKTMRFADDSLKATLQGYIDYINTRRLEGVYQNALQYYNNAKTTNLEQRFREAAYIFNTIKGYKDAEELYNNSLEEAETCRKDAIYNSAIYNAQNENAMALMQSVEALKSIPGWRDADEQVAILQNRIEELEKLAKEAEIVKAKKRKRNKIILASVISAVVLIVVISLLIVYIFIPNSKYNEAVELLNSGDYAKSYELFYDIKGYKDSDDYLSRFVVCYEKKVRTNSYGENMVWEYTYDSKGNMTQKVFTDMGGTLAYEYTYDSKGDKIKGICTHSSGSITTIEYTYDSNGNMTKETYAHSDGSTTTYEYTYDSKGNIIKEVEITGYGDTFTYEYTYDSKGNMIKKVETHSSGDTYTYEYTYDSKGNKTNGVITDSTPFVTKIKYAYDSKGNMTKEVRTSNFDDSTETIEYTYYGEHIFYNP